MDASRRTAVTAHIRMGSSEQPAKVALCAGWRGTVLIREHPIHKPDLESQHAAQSLEFLAGEVIP